MEKVNVTVRLEKESVEFLDALAKSFDRDRSYLIKEAVESYISLHRWQIEEIGKAIAEAEAGDFASDEEVAAMFAELRRVKVRWLKAGTRSLRLVHAHIALNNPAAARAVVERIESSITHLSAFPLSGRAGHVAATRELIVPGLPYIVIYRIAAEFVEILRVFHAAQDISAQVH